MTYEQALIIGQRYGWQPPYNIRREFHFARVTDRIAVDRKLGEALTRNNDLATARMSGQPTPDLVSGLIPF